MASVDFRRSVDRSRATLRRLTDGFCCILGLKTQSSSVNLKARPSIWRVLRQTPSTVQCKLRPNEAGNRRALTVNYIELIERQAAHVFGNEAKADHWLNQPIVGTNKCSRLQAADSEAGYELVKAELERLSHGFAC